MKKEVTPVPRNRGLLAVLVDMRAQIKNSWIFIHENVYQQLLNSREVSNSTGRWINSNQQTLFKWNAANESDKIVIFCEVPHGGWGKITAIWAESIAYCQAPSDPEDIFFLKMEE